MSNPQQPSNVRNKLAGVKNKWKKIFSRNKKQREKDVERATETRPTTQILAGTAQTTENVITEGLDEDDAINKDKDRIRTSCKECLQDTPKFPSRDEVRKKIEEAHKYYGIKCVFSREGENSEPQPTWYYILERPLVEQYVLMNNYIRKLSVLSALKCQDNEESSIEEEASSASSLSDYSDFNEGSELVDAFKRCKQDPEKTARLNEATGLSEWRKTTKHRLSSISSTIATDDFDMVIRDPHTPREPIQESTTDLTVPTDVQDERNSGDHLPDMKDFDLSFNLRKGPATLQNPDERYPTGYQWEGNDCPTKTPLLNLDTSPPVPCRVPGTAKDFMSFRNLTISPEFLEGYRSEPLRSRNARELDFQSFICSTERDRPMDVVLTIEDGPDSNDGSVETLKGETDFPLTDDASEDGSVPRSDSSVLTFIDSKVTVKSLNADRSSE